MATSSRERRQRELAEARAARQTQRRRDAHRRRQQRLAIVAGFVTVVVAASAIAAILLTGQNHDSDTASSPTDAGNPSAAPSAAAAATSKVGRCVYTANGETPARGAALPKAAGSVDTSPATMVITTSAGTMTASLDAAKAPCTVHALLTLAQSRYYDDTVCHRQTGGTEAGISVLQCGDPTGTGSGSPGYGYANENTEGVTYDRGVLAMAHSSAPDSNGSQFFINYANPTKDGAAALAGGYTVFGKITEGLDVLDKLTRPGIEGGGSDGAPASKAKILSITITQGA
ncbi:Peptidyl-prolyl cis-trans isomerase (Rotamase)-cyclophilin family [Frankia canadensis]|uniref:Peptidyl-prolyl cis-trans isomerase (Rotamase)-cyclophilin family n=1 Tax=Frankia canadensis TaxID=1836972 RepID=A0A2I2KYL2_9ACTN|nr:peptidylprolyl isomerase [Frankia canadensis]SNQ50762.1 Peptidyl-prolyl cis-trans isomerase (Rotamase)-cyclophilin family [Frankia canadensis]SOU58052.1 Peptidyl-prolyl cis-trans isomerase (Rotamase)-cyclophilin family [Frankia canadensis]